MLLSDNTTIISGKYKPVGNGTDQGWMMLVKEDGALVKSTKTASPDAGKSLAWVNGIVLKNNASVLVGLLYNFKTYDGHDLIITKRDGSLNPLWTRRFRPNPSVMGSLDSLPVSNQSVWEAENGDLIVLINGVQAGALMSNFTSVLRLSGVDGSVVWSKTFLPVHYESWGYACGAFQSGSSLVITGYLDMPPLVSGDDVPAFYAMRLNWADGSMQLLKRYRYHNMDFGAWSNTFEQYKGRRIAGGYEIYGEEYEQNFTVDRQYVAIQLNENLELTGTKSWNIDMTFADLEVSMADKSGNYWVLDRGGTFNDRTYLCMYSPDGKHRRRRLNTPQNSDDWLWEQNGARIAFKPNGNASVLMNYYSGGKPVTELTQLVAEDTLPGCTGTEVSAVRTELPFFVGPDPTGWRSILDNGVEELSVSLTDQTLLTTESTECKAVVPVTCTTEPPAAAGCNDSSYRKMYSAGRDSVMGYHHHHLLSGNQSLVTGTYTPAGATASNGWMLLLAEDGAVVKSSRMPSPEAGKSLCWTHGTALKNGGSAVLGTLYESVEKGVFDLVLTKRDNNLNALWNRRYALNPAISGNPADAPLANELIMEGDNGDLFLLAAVAGYFSVTGANAHLIARISGVDGSVVWSKMFTSAGALGLAFVSGAFQSNNSVVVTGYQELLPVIGAQQTAIYAMKLSMADGSLQLLKRYRFNNPNAGSWSNFYNQYKTRRINGGYEIYGEVYEDVPDRGCMAVQLDDNLELTGSRGWVTDYEVGDVMKTAMDAAGNIVFINRGRAAELQTYFGVYSRNGKSRRKKLNIPVDLNDWATDQSGIRIAFKASGKTTLLMNYAHNGVPVTELLQVAPEDTLSSCMGSETAVKGMASAFEVKADATPWDDILNNALLASSVSLTDQAQLITETGICKTVVAVDAAALSLGNDTALCNKDSLILKATTGLNNYTWPVDYHLQTIDANTVKVFPDKDTAYIVKAVTTRGCALADTVQVSVWELPQDFLPADTVICSGSSIVLQASATFAGYQWSTGATAPQATVNKAGTYQLIVTDNKGCRGEDAVAVALKNCASYVYIPTGFTPDNNGANDVFRPAVSGNLTTYYFAVYNRWGECVFASREPGSGWNGTYKGVKQTTGTYTWMCKYRLEGDTEKLEKGTVVLIR